MPKVVPTRRKMDPNWMPKWSTNLKMMPKLRQRSAKSTHGVPKASFAPILLNFGGFGATPGAQKEPIGAILESILRPKCPHGLTKCKSGASFWAQNVIKDRCEDQHRKCIQKCRQTILEKVSKHRSKTCAKNNALL